MLYPLRFRPVFQRYLWGGFRLRDMLGKPIGEQSCAESWEVVDHRETQSVVENGPLAGTPLNELMRDHGRELLGPSAWEACQHPDMPDSLRGRFPLLLKYLDAHRDLSVQVHPDDALGARLNPPDLGKTEAWYVVAAEPGSRIYAGLKPCVDRTQFREAIETGTVAELLHTFEPRTGDCVLIRPGTVHAIGAGLLVCEIQQASNTTFRLFDWNRVDADGRPRQLHVDQGIEATNFEYGPVQPTRFARSESPQTLVACEKFILRRHVLENGETVELADPPHQMRIVTVLDGQITAPHDSPPLSLGIGETVLLPASLDPVTIVGSGETPTIVLEILLSSIAASR